MDISSVQKQMEHQAYAIAALASGLTPEELQWKPDPESWSVSEVIDHLVHEEIYDFRCYLKHILRAPDDPWPEFHPLERSDETQNSGHHFQESLANFQSERKKTLEWLAGLINVDWDTAATAPWGAKMTAGDMLASWLAHDLLHLRQLVELRYALTAAGNQTYSVDYAGKW